jgi:hypothetical protein
LVHAGYARGQVDLVQRHVLPLRAVVAVLLLVTVVPWRLMMAGSRESRGRSGESQSSRGCGKHGGSARRTRSLKHHTSLLELRQLPLAMRNESVRIARILTLGTPSSRAHPQRLLVLIPDLIATPASWLGKDGQARKPPPYGVMAPVM